MNRTRDDLPLARSLALLAALFAVVFAALLPSAVAASAATSMPVVLCADGKLVPLGDFEQGKHPNPDDSLSCAATLSAGLAGVVDFDIPTIDAPVASFQTQQATVRPAPQPYTALTRRLPPATAPPTA